MDEIILVEWKDRYAVGIQLIDDQHKSLIEVTNELFRGCVLGQTEAQAYFSVAIKKAVEYIKNHFTTEEQMMVKADYPGYAEHKKLHEEFIRQVLVEAANFNEGRKFVPNHFARFLRDWILEHIGVADQRYKSFLLSRGYR